ncbi:MAG: hypothetical protein GY845_31165 [Planctomycetes bacterium]|nr:hypothetical protein [Planctomycetota bacterium]
MRKGEIRKYIIRYRIVFESFLNLLNVLFVALYVNEFTKASNIGGNTNFIDVINNLGTYNFYTIIIIISFILLYKLHRMQNKSFEENKDNIIDNLLAANCIAITGLGSNKHIRAFFTICDYKHNLRRTVNSHGLLRYDPETVSCFPLNFGVTGKCLETKNIVVEGITEDDVKQYPEDVNGIVLKSLKSIMSIPIFDYYSTKNKIIGFITFDSCESLDVIGFNKEEIQMIGKVCATLISQILYT